MSRSVIAVDRVATFLLAVVALVAGVAALVWWSGAVSTLQGRVGLGALTSAPAQGWWPWAVGVAGVVLVLLGLRWLAAHLPDRGVAQLILPGSGSDGRLLADAGTVATAAATALGATPGVRSARGAIQRDRGQVVARLTATIEREADLELVSQAVDAVSAQLRQVLERDDLRCRVALGVARRNRPMPRVR